MTIDKDEAKKVAVQYHEWAYKQMMNDQAHGFEMWWQETHPEKFGGLTVEEWGMLRELPDTRVGYMKMTSSPVFLSLHQVHPEDFRCITKLLPDPLHFFRKYEGQVIPDPVIVTIVNDEGNFTEIICSEQVEWKNVLFFQIKGVNEEC